MALLAPDEGEILMLEYIVNKTAPNDPVLHLYNNDVTPTDSTVFADLTEPVDGSYVTKTLTGASWTVTQTSVTTASYAEQTFTFAGADNVYGYFVSDGASSLLWVERFTGAPFQLPAGGGEIAITPKITLD